MNPQSRKSNIMPVVRVASGNFLEMYDFMVFGYYAPAIGKTFFPGTSEIAEVLLALSTFGVGFLMRPLGAIVLGAYIDRKGRRAGLLLTLGLISIGTLSIACVPGYNTIGILAPLIVLTGRLIQSSSIEARLFVDYNADSCVIIKDRTRFAQMLRQASPPALHGIVLREGPADYVDPLLPTTANIFVPFVKHFKYSYQNEYRFCWLPPTPVPKVEHLDVQIGTLKDFSDLIVL